EGGLAVAVCWPDPHVIMICHQLENACENCGPMKGPSDPLAKPCFDLVKRAYDGLATDADCAKHAVDNKCTIDNVNTTGNRCGSLDCAAPGCNTQRAACEKDKQWGDSSKCDKWFAKCPCKSPEGS